PGREFVHPCLLIDLEQWRDRRGNLDRLAGRDDGGGRLRLRGGLAGGGNAGGADGADGAGDGHGIVSGRSGGVSGGPGYITRTPFVGGLAGRRGGPHRTRADTIPFSASSLSLAPMIRASRASASAWMNS